MRLTASLAIGVFIIVLLIALHSVMGYWFVGLSSKEVGIQMNAGQPINIVGPGGVYTDIAPFASLQHIDVSEIPFTATDPEVLTNDQPSPQRIGLTLQGTVRRPGRDQADVLMQNWSRYSTFYTDNSALAGRGSGTNGKDDQGVVGLMQNLSNQAMKVCVGGSTFNEAAIGAGRDKLRGCIDTELNTLASGYGLTVHNVVVPNIIISQQVQASLDSITKGRYDQQVAEQAAQTAKTQGDQRVAEQSAQVRAEQSKVQEQSRQDAITAELNRKALEAQSAVIQQAKENELLAAQKDVTIQAAQADAAMQRAKASQADTATLASIYQTNPAYANQKAIEAQASAYKQTDKVIVPAGTNPNLIIGNGTQPVVQTPSR